MRVRSPPLAFLALLALASTAPMALAQDPDGEPGCPQSNPCEVILEVDAAGIADLEPSTFGTGDWILFSIYNADDEAHTISLEGHSFEASIGAGDINDTRPLKLGAPGTYELRDQPSGDVAGITVEAEEVFTDGSSSSSGGNGIPGPVPALVLAVLAASAAIARRK
ncbi:MAG: hypothetical protein ACYC2H_13185 [Thermoplasmatota archaeon]